jgi:hypothetical protein
MVYSLGWSHWTLVYFANELWGFVMLKALAPQFKCIKVAANYKLILAADSMHNRRSSGVTQIVKSIGCVTKDLLWRFFDNPYHLKCCIWRQLFD